MADDSDVTRFLDMCDVSKRQAALELNEDPEVQAALLKFAEKEIVPYWKEIAPVGDPAKDAHSGQYRDSIHAVQGPHGGVAVIADAPNAWFVEYGTNNIHESACRLRTEQHFKNQKPVIE
jgi:hypothetical protein